MKNSKNEVYELIAEDLTHLGGPMGTEYTTDTSLGIFSGDNAIEKARAMAQKHYGNKTKDLGWTKNVSRKDDVLRSDGLLYVMYHIRRRIVR